MRHVTEPPGTELWHAIILNQACTPSMMHAPHTDGYTGTSNLITPLAVSVTAVPPAYHFGNSQLLSFGPKYLRRLKLHHHLIAHTHTHPPACCLLAYCSQYRPTTLATASCCPSAPSSYAAWGAACASHWAGVMAPGASRYPTAGRFSWRLAGRLRCGGWRVMTWGLTRRWRMRTRGSWRRCGACTRSMRRCMGGRATRLCCIDRQQKHPVEQPRQPEQQQQQHHHHCWQKQQPLTSAGYATGVHSMHARCVVEMRRV